MGILLHHTSHVINWMLPLAQPRKQKMTGSSRRIIFFNDLSCKQASEVLMPWSFFLYKNNLEMFVKHDTSADCTFYEEWLLVINVHEAVGTGVAVTSK